MQANYKIAPVRTPNQFLVREILEQALERWYWFVISIMTMATLGYLYIRVTPAEYRVHALIMIDNAPRPSSQFSAADALTGMDELATSNAAVKGMYVLKSGRLMQEVVQRLGLQTQYAHTGRFRNQDLYTTSPVRIRPITQTPTPAEFDAQTLPAGRVRLSGFIVKGKPVNGVYEGAGGTVVATPAGRLFLLSAAGGTGQLVHVTIQDPGSISDHYKNAIDATLDDERAGAIRLTLTDNNYIKAADIVNTLITVYNEYAIEDKNQIAQNTARFIKERLDKLSGELGEVDEQIATYKKNNQLTDIGAEATALLGNMNDVQTTSLNLHTQSALLDMLITSVKDPRNENGLLPANTGLADENIDAMLNSYDEALLQRNRLLENASNSSPVIQELNKKLAGSRTTILGSLQNLQRAASLQLSGLDDRQSAIDQKLALLPGEEKDLQTIFRQQKVKEELYLLLLQKREENALNLATAASNASVVDYASGSRRPVFPNKPAVLSLAFLVGLVLPAAILYVQRHLDMKVRSKKDIEMQTTIPFIGVIPQSATTPATALVVQDAGKDPVSEAFRIVRSNIGFLAQDTGPRVVMITSTKSGEGKTFVSTNLAMSFAMAGHRVLLMNADIRKQGPETRGPGLSNYLSGQVAEWRSIVQPSGMHLSLDIIAAGPLPPNPAELLMSRHLETLVNNLKTAYDYIVLDSVPMGIIADAGITNRVCDLTLYVIRQGVPDRRMLPEIEQLFQNNKLKNMAILLNGASRSNLPYGYGYGYDYK
ncbi:capsular exopolysaccharide family [Chitinophaga costaii]|uniref:Capsular exopolysaccharide family n=1 Tax=Chitinophaga costaii TaxID=1335309 RepID=A0A1C3ZAF1_9BACT|nr:polysaccharide biosynthesis tyrosine autokinase [Chitinophaga costaii]PUZ30294.1 hypothetical protein DCM91_02125 [Chitinophaga costaii]SCB79369.1 capsular exopolysaccharide family [Chitinophaga costaii]